MFVSGQSQTIYQNNQISTQQKTKCAYTIQIQYLHINKILANSVKTNICDVKTRDKGMIHLNSRGFYFHETFTKIKSLRYISEFTVS